MCLQQFPPGTIAELAGPFRGTNDVGEQHRRQQAIEHGILILPRGDEGLDLIDRPVDVSDPGEVVRSGKLHCNGVWHVLGEVSALGRIGGVATPKDHGCQLHNESCRGADAKPASDPPEPPPTYSQLHKRFRLIVDSTVSVPSGPRRWP
jgi:hypothetical protein